MLTEDCLYNNIDLGIDINDLCDTEGNLNIEILEKYFLTWEFDPQNLTPKNYSSIKNL